MDGLGWFMNIDPTARVEDGAVIGEGTTIGPYCIIGANAVIGANCTLTAHVTVTAHTSIGDGCIDLALRRARRSAAGSQLQGRADPAGNRRGCTIREA